MVAGIILGQLRGRLTVVGLRRSECLIVSPGQDLAQESTFLMRRQDAARRSCRIFDSVMPLRGRKTGRLIYALQEAPPNDANFNLWWVRLDSHTNRSAGPGTRITNDETPIADISVTSDGKRLALLRRDFQTDVYLAEVLAQGKQLGALRRFTLDDRNDLPSAWTPDSKAVLFVSNRDGLNHIFRQAVEATHADLLIGGKDNLGPLSSPPTV